MSGHDLCIHGQPVDAYCRACDAERAAPAGKIPFRDDWPRQPMRIAREDLVAIMAAILLAGPAYQLTTDAIEDATVLYDLAHETQAAT